MMEIQIRTPSRKMQPTYDLPSRVPLHGTCSVESAVSGVASCDVMVDPGTRHLACEREALNMRDVAVKRAFALVVYLPVSTQTDNSVGLYSTETLDMTW
jgi:hypothetical protein